MRDERKTVLLILACGLLGGCLHPPGTTVPAALVGLYRFGAFDLDVRLRVYPNGTFRETSWGPLIVPGPDGELPPETFREEGDVRVGSTHVDLHPDNAHRRRLAIEQGLPVR